MTKLLAHLSLARTEALVALARAEHDGEDTTQIMEILEYIGYALDILENV